jgi:hypothetical protein
LASGGTRGGGDGSRRWPAMRGGRFDARGGEGLTGVGCLWHCMVRWQARWRQCIPEGDDGVQRVRRLPGALTELEEVTAVDDGLDSGR